MISYEDGIAALEWLAGAFGFRETTRLTTPDGRLSHGEMRAGDGLIMIASPSPDYRSPKRHRESCEQARRWSAVPWIIDGVLVYVEHLERHFAHAQAAGATILSEIEEGPPGRRYRAEDREGHRWFFFEKENKKGRAVMDPIRRKIPETGAAAGVFYVRGPVRIHYEEFGSGFPLMLIAGGGLNSTIAGLNNPFNAIEEFKGEYRCIAADLRNANNGQSTGPLEIERPWDSYTDDHLGVMDHLGIDRFMVMGFCIGGPFIWNLLRRAPNRVVAAVLAQPSGSRPESRDLFYNNNMQGWGPELVKRRPDITMETVDKFLTKMYRTNADFVFTVTRDFVRNCRTPILILPDDIPAHPYAVAMEAAMLAPNAEVSMFPWKEPKERIPLAVRQIRSFLRAHRPTAG